MMIQSVLYGNIEKIYGNDIFITFSAKCLDNVNTFLNEAFDSSMGTQRAAMGD